MAVARALQIHGGDLANPWITTPKVTVGAEISGAEACKKLEDIEKMITLLRDAGLESANRVVAIEAEREEEQKAKEMIKKLDDKISDIAKKLHRMKNDMERIGRDIRSKVGRVDGKRK